ncbi:MAG: DUF4293 domain-containing protein [Rikenellaceae bacterium]|nr:DUF4293 domain-containing protein [Rikenellaceae bacterium]
MIQRKQSLYMLLGVVCLVLFALLPMFTFNAADSSMRLYTYGFALSEGGDNYALTEGVNLRSLCMIALTAIAGVVMLVNIFLFRRRELQLSILMAEYALLIGIVAFGAYYVWFFGDTYASTIPTGSALTNVPGWSLCLPFVALLTNYLAVRGVASDIALLRSIDRIR